jgi:hypothetical protein
MVNGTGAAAVLEENEGDGRQREQHVFAANERRCTGLTALCQFGYPCMTIFARAGSHAIDSTRPTRRLYPFQRRGGIVACARNAGDQWSNGD